MKNMNDDTSEIDQDPLALVIAFDPDQGNLLFFHLLYHIVGDGTDLAVRVATANDEKIGEAGERMKIENHQFIGLDVGTGTGRRDGSFLGCHVFIQTDRCRTVNSVSRSMGRRTALQKRGSAGD